MAELWWRGRFSALPAAIAFAAVVNALLIAKFIYSDWLSGGLVLLACWVVAAAWLVLTIRAIRELPLLLTPLQASEEPDRFPDAQVAFLRGDYETAEKLLGENLAVEPRDPPALLLLSAIYRHTGRLHASQLLLTEIRKLEVAENWRLEFAAEQSRLERDVEAREEDEVEEDAERTEQAADAEQSAQRDPEPSDPEPSESEPSESENGAESDLEPASEQTGASLSEDLVENLAEDQRRERGDEHLANHHGDGEGAGEPNGVNRAA
ncbi:MAG: hypothetical protein ACF8CQ_05455 [Rhodopirellula sp. JB044]|uniref:hypothetical protein n=1 Tax=Rhodopirellula sp. JB044 TaxID=3342844 RepID=UPI00370B3130